MEKKFKTKNLNLAVFLLAKDFNIIALDVNN